MSRRVLILFAHPAFHRSRAQRALVRAARDLEDVTFHDLYEAYPDFDVDVKREQALLEAHDAIVLQHPFYWYSTPPLVKQWMDLVLEYGWAYGWGGNALAGKLFLSAITAGGSEASYDAKGANRFPVRALLAPVEQTVHLCNMRFLAPFVVFGTHAMDAADFARAAAAYRDRLAALRDGAGEDA
jgi:glutathione-regulated potassium-efflux system ancillary protein KefG